MLIIKRSNRKLKMNLWWIALQQHKEKRTLLLTKKQQYLLTDRMFQKNLIKTNPPWELLISPADWLEPHKLSKDVKTERKVESLLEMRSTSLLSLKRNLKLLVTMLLLCAKLNLRPTPKLKANSGKITFQLRDSLEQISLMFPMKTFPNTRM